MQQEISRWLSLERATLALSRESGRRSLASQPRASVFTGSTERKLSSGDDRCRTEKHIVRLATCNETPALRMIVSISAYRVAPGGGRVTNARATCH